MGIFEIILGVVLFVCFQLILMIIFNSPLLEWSEYVPDDKWVTMEFELEETTEEFAESFINEIYEERKRKKNAKRRD